MGTTARVLSRASGTQVDVESTRTVIIFCGVGLLATLLLAEAVTYLGLEPSINGFDMSAGFF